VLVIVQRPVAVQDMARRVVVKQLGHGSPLGQTRSLC
jgi:hypothetical protein